jgi:dTDP-4-dehydrorhamnose reductase
MTLTADSRVYIAGAGGMLGDAVYRHFSARYETRASDINPRADWLGRVDVAEFDQLNEDVRAFGATILLNLAAQTDLEYCEQNPEQAWRDNALGAENGALIANASGIPYVYISTAGIFGGEKIAYTDYDEPLPLTVYAKSKLHGERFTEQFCDKYFVFRAGWMMGGGPQLDKKFINKLYKQITSGAEVLYAVTDKLGTPTYTVNFAEGIERVAKTGLYGVYNQVCGGQASRYDVAVAFVESLGLKDAISVRPVTSEHFATEYFAERPASEQLVNFKLIQRGLNVMRPWRDCVTDYAQLFIDDLADLEAERAIDAG